MKHYSETRTRHSIEVRNLSKRFQARRFLSRHETLKGFLVRAMRGELQMAAVDSHNTALDNISFATHHGQTIGIIGSNGSGKSTLLKLLAGLMTPTEGEILVNGRVSALIELGSGFHPEISGRENIFINGVMLGLSRAEIAAKFDDIVRFAELEDFIDQPVKNYSSGMFMRLGFSVAVHVTPEILLIDEVLAVGDEGFVHKCFERIAEFKRLGKTIVIVSHDLSTMSFLCDEVIWIEKGVLMDKGFPRRVVDAYLQHVHDQERQRMEADNEETSAHALEGHDEAEAAPEGAAMDEDGTYHLPTKVREAIASGSKADEGAIPERLMLDEQDPENPQERWGSKEIRFTDVKILDATGTENYVHTTGDDVVVEMHYAAKESITKVDFGIGVFNADGLACFGVNTSIDGYAISVDPGDGVVRFRLDDLTLIEGSYFLDVAVHTPDGHPFDYIRRLRKFIVHSKHGGSGVFMPRHTWSFDGSLQPKQTRQDEPATDSTTSSSP